MLTPEEIKERMKDRVVGIVAIATGLHVNTIRKLKNGTAVEPSFETIQKVSQYFEAQEAE